MAIITFPSFSGFHSFLIDYKNDFIHLLNFTPQIKGFILKILLAYASKINQKDHLMAREKKIFLIYFRGTLSIHPVSLIKMFSLLITKICPSVF